MVLDIETVPWIWIGFILLRYIDQNEKKIILKTNNSTYKGPLSCHVIRNDMLS